MDLPRLTLSLASGGQPPPASGLTLALPSVQQNQGRTLRFSQTPPQQPFPTLSLSRPILPQLTSTQVRPVPIVSSQPLSLTQPSVPKLTLAAPIQPVQVRPTISLEQPTPTSEIPNLALVTQFKPPALPLPQISLPVSTPGLTPALVPNLALVSQGKLPLSQISLPSTTVPGIGTTGMAPTVPLLSGFQAPVLPTIGGLPVSTLPIATVPSFPAQFTAINLWPTQSAHYARIRNILSRWVAYLDTSPMGSGKTVVTLKVAQDLRLPIIVVAPLSTLATWRETAAKFGVPIIMTMSYQSMRGSFKKPKPEPEEYNYQKDLSHGLLRRIDEKISYDEAGKKYKKPKRNTTFHPTATLTNYMRSGILFVFDEMHNLKNPGTSQLASAHEIVKEANKFALDQEGNEHVSSAHAIIREAGKWSTKSKVSLLSATPTDKKVQTFSVVKMLGITDYTNMYVYDRSSRKYNGTGIRDLEEFCMSRQPTKTREIIDTYGPLTNRNAISLVYDLYTKVVKEELVSSMTKPTITATLDAKNAFYTMDQYSINLLRAAVGELREAVGFDPTTDTIKVNRSGLAGMTEALVKIETAKVNTMYNLALNKLRESAGNKVLIYLMYKKNIDTLAGLLAEYKPLILTGKTTATRRNQYMEFFQQPNSNYRLIIANPKVGGIGISLDDRDGNYPRFMFISPSYFFIDLHQATGRIHRGTTRSNATVRFVFGRGVEEELNILNALAKKTKVTKSMLASAVGIKMPGDYERIYP